MQYIHQTRNMGYEEEPDYEGLKNLFKVIMNKNLSNYKLKWKTDDRLISYQVDETAQKNFEALEELIDIDNQQNLISFDLM